MLRSAFLVALAASVDATFDTEELLFEISRHGQTAQSTHDETVSTARGGQQRQQSADIQFPCRVGSCPQLCIR